ncbi:MAG TPA: crosslink repair DNA glycosylase YcaQ family protein [Steroidobacter sp.]
MPRAESLSLREARLLALAAQQFARKDAGPCNARSLTQLVRQLGAVQIDSVNVLVRSHYLPAFSRRGAYSTELLDRAAYANGTRTLFEYWGHEASLMPVESYPLFRWRMDDARRGIGTWQRVRRYATEHRDRVEAVLAQIRERGALGASELVDGGRSKGSWWGWSEGKEILEWLFWTGTVTTAQRRNFERLYDLTGRVLPPHICSAPTPSREQAQRELMTIAAQALAVATARDLRDYFRLPAEDARMRLRELIEAGVLLPVEVESWRQPAYMYARAKVPRACEAATLLSPFDSLIWERQRTERLFGFHYRIEIYTPVEKRKHGYYVLPFLLGDRLVARVDLKSERSRSCLQVRGGSVEPGVRVTSLREPLLGKLSELAAWLGLERVEVTSRRGELMKALKASQVRKRRAKAS